MLHARGTGAHTLRPLAARLSRGRRVICLDFDGYGDTTIQAAGGEEAVERYRAGGGDIDLVLLDMVMPGMSGSQVFDTLRALDPHVAVLLSTGYSIDGRVADMLGRGCLGYVQKPYSLATLAEKIDQALAAGGRAPPDPAGPDRPRRLSPG